MAYAEVHLLKLACLQDTDGETQQNSLLETSFGEFLGRSLDNSALDRNSDNVKQGAIRNHIELYYPGGIVHSTHRAEEIQSPNKPTGRRVGVVNSMKGATA